MISEIAFEQIQGNFWYGVYGEFLVIMMKDSGYINATKMCTSGGKDYPKWARLISSHELIQSLEKDLALENTHDTSASKLQDRNGGITPLRSPPCKIVHNFNQTNEERLISGTCSSYLTLDVAF